MLRAKAIRLLEEQERRGMERLSQVVKLMTQDERSALTTCLRAFVRLGALERQRPRSAQKIRGHA